MMDILISHQEKEQMQDASVDFDLSGMLEDEPFSAIEKRTLEPDDSIKKLMNQQTCNFKALDRAMSKINIEISSEKWELEDHLSILKIKWDSIDRIHWNIEDALQGSNLGEYSSKFDGIENKYDELKKQLNSKIWSNMHFEKSAPKIEIPEFHGDYIRWISFKDLFLQTIHKNPTISKSQKMQHLKTKLKGEAERLVQHLPVSTENYDSCWEILQNRYDNRRLQFTSFMNGMQQFPTIQNPNAYNLKRLHAIINESINGLANMGVDVTTWGPIIVHQMAQKLDTTTFSEYSKEIQNNRELPDLTEFLSFLENQFMAFETIKTRQKDTNNSQKPTGNMNFNKPTNKYSFKPNYCERPTYNKTPTLNHDNKDYSKSYHAAYGKCPLCHGTHVLMQCAKFTEMNIPLRNNTVTKLKLCKNCLYSHGNTVCKSSKACKECNLRHHTLLCLKSKNGAYEPLKTSTEQDKTSTSGQQASHHTSTADMEVLLTTVKLRVKSNNGTYITLRGLLDQGSQINLISENAAQMLQLPRQKLNASVSGIGHVIEDCKGRVQLTCKSIHSDYTFVTQAMILKRLTNDLPESTFEKANWPHLQNLKLGDPDYNVCGSIDLLLSADIYADILMDGVLKGDQHSPVAQQTQLGWILCGKLKTFNCHATIFDLTDISKYWESETITQTEDINKDDLCETYYQETTKRSTDGKYIVKMPMLENFEAELGESRPAAVSQFLQLEKRLTKNEKLCTMYKEFINEYSELGHMKLTERKSKSEIPQCFLPHHGVLRENSTTTKLRVVFNASHKTSSGKSLNTLMEKGPNLQKDIQALLLKWKSYKYAYTADIEKMYRCILLSEDQQPLQKIIWRPSPSDLLREHTLCTLTYGTKCAPWLAMRTLKQLSLDYGHKYPAATKALQTQFYLDDLISGHNSLEKAKELQSTLVELLKEGGMNLRKWSANCPELLEQLSEDQISTKCTFDFEDENTKTLGLVWNPKTDSFMFNWNLDQNTEKRLTKRVLLSEISQLYDPMGWLSPVTVTAKLIFQQVWEQSLQWDQLLPEKIQEDWLKLKAEIPYLKTIKIPRWIGSTEKHIKLLGFCDASIKAYSCVIYSHVKDGYGQPVISLLAAKTRVAPIAQKITLPRLELCGALLLSQLIEKAKNSLNENNITIRAWTDSQVVLAWLQGEPTKWEKYVENRAKRIKQIIPSKQWAYIESKQNPADCATRGVSPTKLPDFHLWWKGPEMLKRFSTNEITETKECLFTTGIGTKQKVTALTLTNDNVIIELINKCSSITRVKRIVAWIMRFITRARRLSPSVKPNTVRDDIALPPYLTTAELLTSNELIVMFKQRSDFELEYNLLTKNQAIPKKSSLFKLSPYLEQGIIRVGGRLNKSNLPPGMKNPMILPNSTNKRNRTGNKSYMAMFVSILSIFAIITGSYCASTDDESMITHVQITNLGSERPIYFDTIGKIQLIHDEWTLLTYYNLSTYWQATREYEKYLEQMTVVCHRLDTRFCEGTIMKQILHEMELLKHYNDILISPHKHLSHRKRRGLVDGVGYLANSLFGVLDQQFAEKYKKDIQAIKNNEAYLLNLMQNQTTIMEIENEIMKKNEKNIQHQFEFMNKFINDTVYKLSKVESYAMATNYFNSMSLTAHLLLTNLKNIQELFLNALLDVYKGQIDIHLLTPVNLIKQLNEIAGKLPKTLTFPVDSIETQIKDIYKLLYVKARVTSDYFMFEIHIPLTSDEDFTLYKPIPLPMKTTENQPAFVTISYEYIAVNFRKNTFLSINMEGLKKCIQRSTDNFVCILNIPIKNLESENAPCEAKFLSHETSSRCAMKRGRCDNDWIELHATNTWLAVCCNDACPFRTVCAGEVTSHQVNSSGLITLQQGCVMQNKDVSIYAHNLYHSDSKINLYLAKPPLIEKSINHIVHSKTPQLELAAEDINQAKLEQWLALQKIGEKQLPNTLSDHDIHHYAVSYTLVTVVILVVVAWILNKRGLCLRRKEKIVPSAMPLVERAPMDEVKPTPAARERGQPQPGQDIEFSFD